MAKRNLIIILAFSFLTLLALKFIGYYNKEDNSFIGFFGRLLNKTNNFSFTCNNFDKKDFDIFWQTEDSAKDTLVLNGNLKSNFGYEYGPEKFLIEYKGVTLCSDGFFSTNNNDTHDVEINISKAEYGFEITFLIDKVKTTKRIIMSQKNRNRKKADNIFSAMNMVTLS
jgi:hypothetical protein